MQYISSVLESPNIGSIFFHVCVWVGGWFEKFQINYMWYSVIWIELGEKLMFSFRKKTWCIDQLINEQESDELMLYTVAK